MNITLENGLNVTLLLPEKTIYRVVSVSGNYKDFFSLEEAESLLEYDFFNRYTLYKIVQTLDNFGKVTDTKMEVIK